MTLIEKLMRFQTIQGPYLGDQRPVTTPTPAAQNFAALVSKPVPAVTTLQSAAQQLQISVTTQTSPAPLTPPPAPQLLPNSQLTLTPQLSQTTLLQIQQHPVESRFSLQIEDLMLLELLKRQVRKRPIDQLVPSAHAQLSWLPTERPFLRLTQTRRKLSVRGISFIRFRFAWEGDEPEDPRQQRRQHEPADPWELLQDAAE